MGSEKRTLIVFDTNKLRSVVKGEPSYGSFEFSEEFEQVNNFIKEVKLADLVKMAIPRIVVEELLKQKIEQYETDLKDFHSIKERLSMLPNTSFVGMTLPGNDFNCSENLKQLLNEFILKNNINIIEFPDDQLSEIFKNIIKRAIDKKSPFKQKGNSLDSGFKDVLIWESILNYNALDNYNKVIMISNDSGFDECISEFESIVKKYFVLTPSVDYVKEEINKDYDSIIQKNKFLDFVNNDYFKDHIAKELSQLNSIIFDEKDCSIESARVIDYIDSVDYFKEEETGAELITIISLVKCNIDVEGVNREILVKAKTYLDESKGIDYTDFEVVGNEGNEGNQIQTN